GVNFFLAIKQKTPNRWVSNFRGSLHVSGLFYRLKSISGGHSMKRNCVNVLTVVNSASNITTETI
ncbi:hypothetical protein, partial [Erwinia mallotivora]|uniref:hypothetical protein n=1 Tax=Erwinia mallotivora TaxID=69222 RepID=UPI003B84561B